MDHFQLTLLSDIFAYYFPAKTVPNCRTKLATSLELQPDTWEIVLVEISCPKDYKKRFLQNTINLDGGNHMSCKTL